jgi:hypothetical protein
MKKILVTLLICIYGLSSFGIGKSEFYCCGKLKSVNFSFAQEPREKGLKSESDDGSCCKTQHKYFKVKDNHLAVNYGVNGANTVIYLQCITKDFGIAALLFRQTTFSNRNHLPRPPAGVPVYLSNCNFLI